MAKQKGLSMSITNHFSQSEQQICTIAGGANSDVSRIPAVGDTPAVYRKVMNASYTFWVQYEENLLSAINERLPMADSRYVVNNKRFSKDADGTGTKTLFIETYDAGVDLIDWVETPVIIDNCQYTNLFCHPTSLLNCLKGCLQALYAIHKHQIVHLDIKANNICIPFLQKTDLHSPISIDFANTVLIDFGFSLWWSRLPLGEDIKFALGYNQQKAYQSQTLIDALKHNKRSINAHGKAVFNHEKLKQLDYSADLFAIGFLFDTVLKQYKNQRVAADADHWQNIDLVCQKLIDKLLQFDDGLYAPFDLQTLPHPQFIQQLDGLLGLLNCQTSKVTLKVITAQANTTPISPQRSPLAQVSPLAFVDANANAANTTGTSSTATQNNTSNLQANSQQSDICKQQISTQLTELLEQQPQLSQFSFFHQQLENLLKRDKVTNKDVRWVDTKLSNLQTFDDQIQIAASKHPSYFDASVLNVLHSSFTMASNLSDNLNLLNKHVDFAEKQSTTRQANTEQTAQSRAGSNNNSYPPIYPTDDLTDVTEDLPDNSAENLAESLAEKRKQLEREEWQYAQSKHSKSAYQEFINRNPNSEFSPLASQAIRQLEALQAWENSQSQHTIDAYQKFLADYPNSEHTDAATAAIVAIRKKQEREQQLLAEQTSWQVAQKKNSKKLYKQFIKAHPNSSKVAQAKQAIKTINSKRWMIIVLVLASIAAAVGYYYSQFVGEECYYVSETYANVRSRPSLTEDTKLYRINRNDRVCINDKEYPETTNLKSVWYKVKKDAENNRQAGWVSSITLSTNKVSHKQVFCDADHNDVYYVKYESTAPRTSKAQTPDNVHGFLLKNDLVCASNDNSQNDNSWIKVTMNDNTPAWVQRKALQQTSCAIVTSESGLNIRNKPNTSGQKVGWVNQYARVCIVGDVRGSWAQVSDTQKHQMGYVNLKYTTEDYLQ